MCTRIYSHEDDVEETKIEQPSEREFAEGCEVMTPNERKEHFKKVTQRLNIDEEDE